MQRLTKYGLLLKAIHRNTDNESDLPVLTEIIKNVDSFVQSVNLNLKQKQETDRLHVIIARIESYEVLECKDEELEKLIRIHNQLDLTSPMFGCSIEKRRNLLLEGDLKLKDNLNSKLEVHCFLLTDMLLICKSSIKKSAHLVKVIRQPYIIDRLIVTELNRETPSFASVYLNEYNVAIGAFILQNHDAKKLKYWMESIKRAQLLYSQAKHASSRQMSSGMISEEFNELIEYNADYNYDFDSFSNTLVPRSPIVSSSRNSRLSSLTHSHSGSVEITETSSAFNQGFQQHSNQKAISISSDESIQIENNLATSAPTSTKFFILPTNSPTSMSLCSSPAILPSQSKPIFYVPEKSSFANNLTVQSAVTAATAGGGASATTRNLVQSLPNLTLTANQSKLPPPSSLPAATTRQSQFAKNTLLVPNTKIGPLLSPTIRGTSYPPPSPPRICLKRGLAFAQNKNPPLLKTRHVNSFTSSSLSRPSAGSGNISSGPSADEEFSFNKLHEAEMYRKPSPSPKSHVLPASRKRQSSTVPTLTTTTTEATTTRSSSLRLSSPMLPTRSRSESPKSDSSLPQSQRQQQQRRQSHLGNLSLRAINAATSTSQATTATRLKIYGSPAKNSFINHLFIKSKRKDIRNSVLFVSNNENLNLSTSSNTSSSLDSFSMRNSHQQKKQKTMLGDLNLSSDSSKSSLADCFSDDMNETESRLVTDFEPEEIEEIRQKVAAEMKESGYNEEHLNALDSKAVVLREKQSSISKTNDDGSRSEDDLSDSLTENNNLSDISGSKKTKQQRLQAATATMTAVINQSNESCNQEVFFDCFTMTTNESSFATATAASSVTTRDENDIDNGCVANEENALEVSLDVSTISTLSLSSNDSNTLIAETNETDLNDRTIVGGNSEKNDQCKYPQQDQLHVSLSSDISSISTIDLSLPDDDKSQNDSQQSISSTLSETSRRSIRISKKHIDDGQNPKKKCCPFADQFECSHQKTKNAKKSPIAKNVNNMNIINSTMNTNSKPIMNSELSLSRISQLLTRSLTQSSKRAHPESTSDFESSNSLNSSLSKTRKKMKKLLKLSAEDTLSSQGNINFEDCFEPTERTQKELSSLSRTKNTSTNSMADSSISQHSSNFKKRKLTGLSASSTSTIAESLGDCFETDATSENTAISMNQSGRKSANSNISTGSHKRTSSENLPSNESRNKSLETSSSLINESSILSDSSKMQSNKKKKKKLQFSQTISSVFDDCFDADETSPNRKSSKSKSKSNSASFEENLHPVSILKNKQVTTENSDDENVMTTKVLVLQNSHQSADSNDDSNSSRKSFRSKNKSKNEKVFDSTDSTQLNDFSISKLSKKDKKKLQLSSTTSSNAVENLEDCFEADQTSRNESNSINSFTKSRSADSLLDSSSISRHSSKSKKKKSTELSSDLTNTTTANLADCFETDTTVANTTISRSRKSSESADFSNDSSISKLSKKDKKKLQLSSTTSSNAVENLEDCFEADQTSRNESNSINSSTKSRSADSLLDSSSISRHSSKSKKKKSTELSSALTNTTTANLADCFETDTTVANTTISRSRKSSESADFSNDSSISKLSKKEKKKLQLSSTTSSNAVENLEDCFEADQTSRDESNSINSSTKSRSADSLLDSSSISRHSLKSKKKKSTELLSDLTNTTTANLADCFETDTTVANTTISQSRKSSESADFSNDSSISKLSKKDKKKLQLSSTTSSNAVENLEDCFEADQTSRDESNSINSSTKSRSADSLLDSSSISRHSLKSKKKKSTELLSDLTNTTTANLADCFETDTTVANTTISQSRKSSESADFSNDSSISKLSKKDKKKLQLSSTTSSNAVENLEDCFEADQTSRNESNSINSSTKSRSADSLLDSSSISRHSLKSKKKKSTELSSDLTNTTTANLDDCFETDATTVNESKTSGRSLLQFKRTRTESIGSENCSVNQTNSFELDQSKNNVSKSTSDSSKLTDCFKSNRSSSATSTLSESVNESGPSLTPSSAVNADCDETSATLTESGKKMTTIVEAMNEANKSAGWRFIMNLKQKRSKKSSVQSDSLDEKSTMITAGYKKPERKRRKPEPAKKDTKKAKISSVSCDADDEEIFDDDANFSTANITGKNLLSSTRCKSIVNSAKTKNVPLVANVNEDDNDENEEEADEDLDENNDEDKDEEEESLEKHESSLESSNSDPGDEAVRVTSCTLNNFFRSAKPKIDRFSKYVGRVIDTGNNNDRARFVFFDANGNIMKRRKRNFSWLTDTCRDRIRTLILKKLNDESKVESFLEFVDSIMNSVTKSKMFANGILIKCLMVEFAKHGVITTPRQFYIFIVSYFKQEFYSKICPMCPFKAHEHKDVIPFGRANLDIPILDLN